MEVLFETRRLSTDLSSHTNRQRRYGDGGAKKIALRLQQMIAAPTLQDLRHMPGHYHELHEDVRGRLAVDVHQTYRVVFRPTQTPPPTRGDGGLDWSQVASITITSIRHYVEKNEGRTR